MSRPTTPRDYLDNWVVPDLEVAGFDECLMTPLRKRDDGVEEATVIYKDGDYHWVITVSKRPMES